MAVKNNLKIATTQFNAIAGNLAHNLKEMVSLIKEASKQNVHLVVFPELAISGYDLSIIADDRCTINEFGSGLSYILDACKLNKIYAVFGACVERPEGITNSAFIINDNGEIIGIYDKKYLDHSEKNLFIPGNKSFLFNLENWKFSIAFSDDLKFADHSKSLVEDGVNGYLVLGACISSGSENQVSTYFSEKANENSIFVVFSNFVGTHGGMHFCGHSSIYSPNGSIIAECGNSNKEISYAVFDDSVIQINNDEIQSTINFQLNSALSDN